MARGETYDEFVAKFEPKKTTDDCYTPDTVHAVVQMWVADRWHVPLGSMVRPFWPGGDYQRDEYPDGCVVVDNPPFSILTEITNWYAARGIDYFLYAPSLTLFGNRTDNCKVVCDANITYQNGAKVRTSFLTSLERDLLFFTAPDLMDEIEAASEYEAKRGQVSLPKYEYLMCVATSARIGWLCRHHTDFSVLKSDAVRIGALDSQRDAGKAIFGSGFLLSERAAAERAAAKRWPLSERELALQASLG